jgi:hypothetical protein
MRKIEDWVDIQSDTPLQAEALAATIPNVISVFGRSAIPAGKPVGQSVPVGVLEDEDE